MIRWGADASSDVLRQRARCTACGRKWGGEGVGFLPFPADHITA